MIRSLLATLMSIAAVCGAAAGTPGALVSAEWVAANRARIVILDVRADAGTFLREGHIAGSALVEWSEVRARKIEDGEPLEDMLPTAERFTALMRKSGVKSGSSIVVASRGLDANDVFMATRLHWQLRYFGHDDVAVLDGGVAAWAAASQPVTRKPVRPRPAGDWTARAERRELLASTSDVAAAIQSRSPALADARPLRDYLGLEYYEEKVAGPGHIPSAKHFDSSLFLLSVRPARFRPVAEIRQIAAGLGLAAEAPVIAYCNTGDWASGAWFVLYELLGNKSAALYDGSMHAWARGRTRPRTLYKLE